MNTNNEKYKDLSDAFDVTSEIVKSQDVSKELKAIASDNGDVRKDYEYTRGNLYSIIEKGQEAINSILELAQESETPRAYEAAGQLIKNVSDATDKLIDLQKKMKDLEAEDTPKGPQNVTNALFVGSTAELQKLLKKGLTDKNNA